MQGTVVACLLLSTLLIVSGQQRFQRRGDNYLVKASIHRPNSQNYAVNVNEQSRQQQVQGQGHRAAYRRHPWRQGDRITKEELVQNLARALLARKKTSAEIKEEKRKDNEEKFREYTLAQVLLKKNPPKPESHPVSRFPQQAIGTYSSSSANGAKPAYPQVPIQTKMEQKDKYYSSMNAGPREQQPSLTKIKETHYERKIVRGRPQQPVVQTREYIKSNNFQKRK